MDQLQTDPVLGEAVDEHGPLELEPAADPFERLIVSIVNQQLSTASAAAIRERFFEQFEITPESLVDADEDELREIGLSRQKIDYIHNAAQTFLEDGLTRKSFAQMSDEEVVEEMTAIHGVGVWTAKMFLMFSLGRKDVFPVEDLGIRNGMTQLYGDLSREEMVEKAEQWRPHRSIAALHIWRSYEDAPETT